MSTVLIELGEQSPDGTPPPRAYFQLIEGKLHVPTIRTYFRLANVSLDGIVYPTDDDGFTFSTFADGTTVRASGDPAPEPGSQPVKVLLIRMRDVYGDAEQPGGKRKVVQIEENLGLWTLPPYADQPRTLPELTASIRSFLQIEDNTSWQFKHRWGTEFVPILSDAALIEAFRHLRSVAAQYADDDAAVNQHCRLYLISSSEEVAPRDLIRARITGLLDAAAATSVVRDAPPAPAPVLVPAPAPAMLPPQLPGTALQLPTDNTAAAMALLGNHLAAAGYVPYLALQQQGSDGLLQDAYGMVAAGDGDGEDGEDGEHGDGGTMSGLLGYQRQSGSEGVGGGGNLSASQAAALKKESKTRHADGRFKNETQHQRKMADMSRKIAELFDGTITNLVEVCDHKKIMCRVCNHACTAYSAYHTDCVRKHFLRHHESTLRERGVDVARWRKEYEVSQKVKRQQQLQQDQPQSMIANLPPGVTLTLGPQGQISLPAGMFINGLHGLNGLNGLGALGVGNAGGIEGEAAQRGLQAQLLSMAGFPVDLSLGLPMLAQLPGGANGAGGASGVGANGAPTNSVTALLQQVVGQEEHGQMQAAGALSTLMSAASTASINNGQPQGASAPSLTTQLSGALGNGGSGGGATTVSLAPMARMASGTVTTEMPLPPPPPPLPAAQGVPGGGGEPLLHEVGSLHMTRSASVASQGPGSLPSIRSPQVITTDMSQPSA